MLVGTGTVPALGTALIPRSFRRSSMQGVTMLRSSPRGSWSPRSGRTWPCATAPCLRVRGSGLVSVILTGRYLARLATAEHGPSLAPLDDGDTLKGEGHHFA
jgi:hypothetical protein